MLLPDITIGCRFDSRPRIDSVFQKTGFCYGVLGNAMSSVSGVLVFRFTVIATTLLFDFQLHLRHIHNQIVED